MAAQKPKKRLSRISQTFDFTIPKTFLSDLEKDVQDLIDGITQQMDSQKSPGGTTPPPPESKESGLGENVTALRQHMRVVRRWRNGSAPCTPVECVTVADGVHNAYVSLLREKIRILTDQLTDVDGFISILDEDSNDLRQNMEEDLRVLEKRMLALESAGSTSPSSLQHQQSQGGALGLCKETDKQIRDLQETVKHLQSKIVENNNQLGANLSIQSRMDDPLDSSHGEGPSTLSPATVPQGSRGKKGVSPGTFESNPGRNRVLATADTIRSLLQGLKTGRHLPMGATSPTQIQSCAENDAEVLRRQLCKVRRWQQSVESFSHQDVDDLHDIVSAIHRHVGDEEHSAPGSSPPSPTKSSGPDTTNHQDDEGEFSERLI